MKFTHKLRAIEEQISFSGITSLKPEIFFAFIRIAGEVRKFFELHEFTPWLTVNPVHEGVYETYCFPHDSQTRPTYRRFHLLMGWTPGFDTIEEASKDIEFDLLEADEILCWRGLTKDLRGA